jgi:DNA-binding NarL/FixJ family response regulator
MKKNKNSHMGEKLLARDLDDICPKIESSYPPLSLTSAPYAVALTTGRSHGAAKIGRLTAAESRVLSHVSRAKTNKEIAAALGISPATVKRHLEKILTKLQMRNRVEAAIYGLLVKGCPLQGRSRCVIREARDGGRSFADSDWSDDR